jgi:nicotinamidase/pyrazinamidase
MKVLLLVDLQNDFLPGGSLPVPSGDHVIPFLNELQNDFDLILATKDWHPRDHISFAKTHGKQVGEEILVKDTPQRLWPVHCVQGTKGAEFPPKLRTEKIAHVFHKGSHPDIDSYSTFFDNAHLRSTGLGEYLKEKGIHEIWVAGLATDYCVKYSVLDARKLGLEVHVILPGCRGIDVNEGETEKSVKEMEEAGAKIHKNWKLDN